MTQDRLHSCTGSQVAQNDDDDDKDDEMIIEPSSFENDAKGLSVVENPFKTIIFSRNTSCRV